MVAGYSCEMDLQIETEVRKKHALLAPLLDEQTRRLWAAAEAQVLGRSGVSVVARATGLSRTTIHQGLKDLVLLHEMKVAPKQKRIRAAGGGRKPIDEYDPTIRRDLEQLVDPVTRGDPESPLRWTCKSTRQLAAALEVQGHVVGRQKVADLLADLGYSLQANRKIKEGSADHPDRDDQFNVTVQATHLPKFCDLTDPVPHLARRDGHDEGRENCLLAAAGRKISGERTFGQELLRAGRDRRSHPALLA